MSRCEHNEKIIKFCINSSCNSKESGGCQFCLKKNHCHIGAVNFIKQNQLQDIIKFFTATQDKKVKNRSLREAIYNYFNILKNQISSSIDCLSTALLNRVSYPYIWQQGYLDIFKKLKHRDYNKITPSQMRQFCQFKQNISQQFQANDIAMYFQQCQFIYQKIASLHLIFAQFTQQIEQVQKTDNNANISLYYNKVSQIYQGIQKDSNFSNSKKVIDKKQTSHKKQIQNKKQNVQKPQALKIFKQNMKNVVTKQQKTQQPKIDKQKTKQSKQNQSEAQKLYHSQNRPIRNRKVSIDHKCGQLFKGQRTYQDKQKQINERKKKLDQMINHQKSQNNTTIDQLEASQQDQYKSQTKNDSSSSQQKTQNLFQMLARQGINFPELIVHTILPAAQEKKKLYEQQNSIQKRTIKIPVRVVQQNQGEQQIQSPILKLKKSSNTKGFKLGLTKVSTKEQKKAQTQTQTQKQKQRKKQQLSKQNQPQTLLKQNQANSLFLFMQSLKSSAQKAIPLLQASLKYSANNFSSAQYLSFLYLQCNKPKQCLDVCNKALQLVQNQPTNHQIQFHLMNNKAAALNQLGRYSQSIPILQKCLQTTKKDVLYKNLGDSYFSLGIIQKAIINYQNATILNDENDEAFYNLGVCLFSQKNYYSCKMKVQKALMLDQQNQSYIDLYNEVSKLIKSS